MMLRPAERRWPISRELLEHYLLDQRLPKTKIGELHGCHPRSVHRLVQKYHIETNGLRRTSRRPLNLRGLPDPFRPVPIPKPKKKVASTAVAVVEQPPAPAPVAPPPPKRKHPFRLGEWKPRKPSYVAEDIKPEGYRLSEKEIEEIYGDFVYPELCLIDEQGKAHPMSRLSSRKQYR